jgi:DNA polymerase III subunit gamma/tau
LEEPPEHVKFVFATTEPQKVLATILSRCQRFDLRRIPAPLIASHLGFIASEENVTLEPEAAAAIAKGAEGGLRDAESMLDQLVAFCGNRVTEEDVLKIFGFTAEETVFSLCDALLQGSPPSALKVVHDEAEKGKDLSRLMADLIGHLRNILVAKADPEGLRGELPGDSLEALKDQAGRIEMERLLDLIEQFADAEGRMKWAPNKKLHFEIAVIKAIQTLQQATLDDVIDTLTSLRSGEAPKLKPRRVAPPASKAAAAAPERKPPLAKAEPPESVQTPVSEPVELPKGAESSPAEPETEPEATAEVKPGQTPSNETIPPGEIWVKLVKAIRKQRPLISAWLDYGSLLEVGEDFVLIGFAENQNLAMDSLLRPNNRKLLELTLKELLGRPVSLRCELRADLIVAPPDQASEEDEAPKIDPMEEFKNDPLIRKALDLFQAEISS